MTRIDPRAYAIAMLRRDLYREPTEREVQTWVDWFEVSGAFAPVGDVEPEAVSDGEAPVAEDRRGRLRQGCSDTPKTEGSDR